MMGISGSSPLAKRLYFRWPLMAEDVGDQRHGPGWGTARPQSGLNAAGKASPIAGLTG